MKKSTMTIALAAALLSVSVAQAGEFTGGWIGVKAGNNNSDVTGVSAKNASTYGLEGGYNWDMGGFLLGVDGFADFNQKVDHATATPGAVSNYGSDALGLDVKLGLPSGNWLPYAKLGYASVAAKGVAVTGTGSGAHLGLGVEYKFAPHWSVAGEYTTVSDKFNNNTQKLNNNNFTIGLNYYFDSVAPAAVAAAIVAPVLVKEVAKPAPVVAPKESFKTIFSDKPVTIEGANFDTSSAKLKPAADKKLNEVVDFAAKYKESNLAVTGYTDSTGSKKLNQKLSEKRAASVKAFLVKKGVAADRITAKGAADANPVADNKTKAGRAQNRRVEINSVVKESKQVRVTE
ncbi:MAG: outer membrane beta-barrel protein [Nitrosomonadales bacterium]